MKLVTGPRHFLEQRLQERRCTWAEIRPAIVKEDGEMITVDVDHSAYPKAERAAVAPEKWPKLVKLIARFRQPADKGIGDTLARNLAKFGAKSMAHAYTMITGADCGCENRQKKLNDAYPYGK